MESDQHEKENLIAQYPEKAKELHKALADWNNELEPKGLPPTHPVTGAEKQWFEHYLNVKD